MVWNRETVLQFYLWIADCQKPVLFFFFYEVYYTVGPYDMFKHRYPEAAVVAE